MIINVSINVKREEHFSHKRYYNEIKNKYKKGIAILRKRMESCGRFWDFSGVESLKITF